MNIPKLMSHVKDGFVSVQKHPSAELYIYNYTSEVQYAKLWDDITLNTRGLILDGNHNIVAKPFGKFFNLEELQPSEIPNTSFDVYEKLDGSLGILYWIENTPYIATRGSFTSEQALHATYILHNYFSHVFPRIDRSATYLFEIIYPENRIVVDYGPIDRIVLLTVIDNETGLERIEDIGFDTVLKYDGLDDYKVLKNLDLPNREGFVVRFNNGFRMKIKFSEYIRLHRIITGVSNIAIWEYLKDDIPYTSLLERVPDEFYDWVRETVSEIISNYEEIVIECESVYKILSTRKETAEYFNKQKYPKILFLMLDGRDYSSVVWKLVRPKYAKPFFLQN